MNKVIKFSNGEIEVLPKIKYESIRATQKQLCKLLKRDKSVISRHIRNIFKSGKLNRDLVVANFATTANNGKTYQVEYYNLDIISK